ncbi:hypothetical protein [Cyclobacterium xiamenense]|uniref:hypothetical protein n=1 Tax=Cyclobacterium xiamenense TaxID=1297121 RepID=UPI0012B8EE3C|nr:hypothetical protein [Cyclobacterium xiamenense]
MIFTARISRTAVNNPTPTKKTTPYQIAIGVATAISVELLTSTACKPKKPAAETACVGYWLLKNWLLVPGWFRGCQI